MKKTIVLLMSLVLLSACVSKNAETVEINKDSVPSLYAIVGEKKITGTRREITNGIRTVELTYKKDSITHEEIIQYADHLLEMGYLVTEGIQSDMNGDTWQIGNTSVTEGHVVLITFRIDTQNVITILYQGGEGYINPHE